MSKLPFFYYYFLKTTGYSEELIDHIEDETISAFQRMMMALASVCMITQWE